MIANMGHIMRRTICSLSLGIGLFLVSAADASAHRIEYRPYIAHDHHVYSRTRSFPGWLRRNREFQHWYRHSHYRLTRHMSWHRLYDVYRFERRHRWHGRRIYDKGYRYNSDRTYQRKPMRRRQFFAVTIKEPGPNGPGSSFGVQVSSAVQGRGVCFIELDPIEYES